MAMSPQMNGDGTSEHLDDCRATIAAARLSIERSRATVVRVRQQVERAKSILQRAEGRATPRTKG